MATPMCAEGGGSYNPSRELKGYGTDLFNLLYYIENALPLRDEKSRSSLTLSFKQAGDFILQKIPGEHEDFSKVVAGLSAIADKQLLLRKSAVETIVNLYCSLPAGDPSVNATVKNVLTKFLGDPDAAVRLATIDGLKMLGIAELDNHTKREFAETLSKACSAEQDPAVKRGLEDAIAGMEKGEIDRIQKSALSLKF